MRMELWRAAICGAKDLRERLLEWKRGNGDYFRMRVSLVMLWGLREWVLCCGVLWSAVVLGWLLQAATYDHFTSPSSSNVVIS